ncbi:Ubiquinone/menaquinone biosynthesis C-methyltransferase UbiE [Aquisphaera giovannonii]|uniref:Ubiquinone/menaquinone biosynthesis C-methyltransferase UbiE n=1 Tax=Aquisphaera giovannonii TaxID=406548 RepID=A0A5B9VWQ2_9BACT|nr:class I SAM-dependent methyltransferase [Aquisphaera giovannonii]QEH32494.1 Ubiquinone/menaquinone biosynthesis C-methyltransferase UbiE [Aquisphaera giovannonii]
MPHPDRGRCTGRGDQPGRLRRLLLAATAATLAVVTPASEASAQERPAGAARANPNARRDRPGFYKGRRIADVMSWEGVEWLFRETRVQEEQPEAMLDALKIRPGDTVADVGAGAGYHSIRLARRVGEKGTVLATDVQREMIAMLERNAREAGLANIRPVLATQRSTKLPDGKVDLILMVDVYHEATDPEALLKGLLVALRPGGRLVLVEFRGEDPEVPIKPEHKMTVKQVRREVEPQGFRFVDSLEFLPWQHVIIFDKPEDTPKRDEAGKAARPAATPSGDTSRRP